ncbi:hypothetical protein [Ketogulonicigenium vulgare]|uniref:hypothetical protein n=1 Tax=Ketogulonicigenium vulgare TaxID=92945 RepID=UPI0023584972|nr:hypothetical protein [Ketogulonicigenium vulgare]
MTITPSQKDFAAMAGVNVTTYNTQEIKGTPSMAVMVYLYENHRIDFNFILNGDYITLPGDVQDALFAVLRASD